MSLLPLLLSVMLLEDPENGLVDTNAARAISADADRVVVRGDSAAQNVAKSIRITSRTSDFDRKDGVVMFEGDVVVRYANDCVMCSDKLYAFFSGTNELSRIVAIQNVSITNETRVGACEMATFRRNKSEIEMFWDGKNRLAKLIDHTDGKNEFSGTRIKFWLDSEQVEVENSQISVEQAVQRGKEFL